MLILCRMKNYGKALKELRAKSNMTQAKLAEALNVTYQTVSKWENNVNTPDISALEKICNVYGITVDEFLRMAEENGASDNGEDPAASVDNGNSVGEERVSEEVGAFCPKCGGALKARFCGKCGYDREASITDDALDDTSAQTECDPSPAQPVARKKLGKGALIGIIIAAVIGTTIFVLSTVLPFVFLFDASEKTPDNNEPDIEPDPVSIAVSFDAGGGTGYMSSMTVMSNEQFTFPNCTFERKGYKFVHWTDGVEAYSAGTKTKFWWAPSTVVLTAIWRPIIYTMRVDFDLSDRQVTFDGEQCRVYTDIQCTYGVDPLAAVGRRDPQADGFVFSDYTVYDADGNVYDGDRRYITTVDGATVCAVMNWVSGEYAIQLCDSFYYNFEYWIEGCFGTNEYTLPTAAELFGVRTGYTFKRWRLKSVYDYGEEIYFEDGATVSDLKKHGFLTSGSHDGHWVEFEAEWEPTVYTVVFDGNGGVGDMSDLACTYNEWYTLEKNKFAKTGYAFGGWEYDGNVYLDGAEVSNLTADGGTVIFTARWIEYFDGNGTESSPYIISDYDELNRMSEFVRYAIGADNAYYALISDIDCGGKPLGAILGYGGDSFTGFFDGGNHVVSNAVFVSTDGLYASTLERKYSGLFGAVSGGRVSNVGIENYTMDLGSDINYAAPLCGFYGSHEPISNCYASGTISLENAYKNTLVVGGLVGYMSGGMSDCFASGSINMKYTQPSGEQWSGSNLYVAGFVARQSDGDVERCYADVDINFDIAPDIDIYDNLVCGLFYTQTCRAFNCFASGSIHSNRYYTASGEWTSFRYVDIFGSGYRPDSPLYISADSSVTFDDYPDWTKECEGVTQTANANLRSLDWLADNLTFDASVWEEVDGELPRLKAFGG